jgi:hypothetical protein
VAHNCFLCPRARATLHSTHISSLTLPAFPRLLALRSTCSSREGRSRRVLALLFGFGFQIKNNDRSEPFSNRQVHQIVSLPPRGSKTSNQPQIKEDQKDIYPWLLPPLRPIKFPFRDTLLLPSQSFLDLPLPIFVILLPLARSSSYPIHNPWSIDQRQPQHAKVQGKFIWPKKSLCRPRRRPPSRWTTSRRPPPSSSATCTATAATPSSP